MATTVTTLEIFNTWALYVDFSQLLIYIFTLCVCKGEIARDKIYYLFQDIYVVQY
uniref:Uncharacterized protein n=1 Tax=Arion vulgaris TaxID=1028688 RepID=A0A0B6ZPE9_9EUPU